MTFSSFISTDVVLISLIVIVFILAVLLLRLEIKMKNLLKGSSGKSLEDSIFSSMKRIENIELFEKESKEYFKNLEHRLRRSPQGIEVIRFNAFKGEGIGGNQSFAVSIIDENGDGAVLSSLYSRDRVSVFAKPIQKFSSSIELSAEEKAVIAQAQNRITK